jgi:hypothetical protein
MALVGKYATSSLKIKIEANVKSWITIAEAAKR